MGQNFVQFVIILMALKSAGVITMQIYHWASLWK